VLFFVGVGIALAIAVASAWADYEGMSYFATGAGYEPYSGLHCPILLSRSETGTVSTTFENTDSEDIEPYYAVEISGVTASRQLEGHVLIHPGSSQDVAWTVDAGDVDLGYFILVKEDVLPSAGYRTREATCGILMLPLGRLGGESVLLGAVLVSMLCILAAMILPAIGLSPSEAARLDREASSNRQRLYQSLGVSSGLALLSGLAGWWVAAVILFIISLFLVVISLRAAESD